MLAVSPLRNTTTNNEYEKQDQTGSFKTSGFGKDEVDLDFSDGGLLDSIDFGDLFLGINDGDVLPDLEVDPEILAEFSGGGSSSVESEKNTSVSDGKVEHIPRKDEEDKVSGSGSGLGIDSSTKGEEIVSKRDESMVVSPIVANKEGYNNNKGRKSSSTQAKNNNNNQGKKKVKVDWTPELHRRFVQAVEQLGVDKAVPSRILELMGIDCLTRHNIASHLQKYRSHRKHLLAREAEAANWSQRRQLYGGASVVGGGGGKRNTTPWHAPTMGFPPITPMHAHPFRPLHVWGHPSMDQSLIHIWPKHLTHSPSPPPTWVPPPLPDPSYWHHHHQRVPNGLTPGTPCFPRPMAVAPPPARSFGTSPVPGIPPHGIYKVDHHGNNIGVSVSSPQSTLVPSFDFHPTKESIDAAIGDVVSKPWLPLPLGLKPPALDSVLVELQRHGVPKIPPAAAAALSS